MDLESDRRPPARVIFILSSERSGSTLLRVMLGKHSRIVACGELFLLRYSDFDSWHQAKPLALHSLVEFFELVGKPLSGEEICRTCRSWTTARVYHWLMERLADHQMLVDKTPAYVNELETLNRTLEFAPFYIWLTRHPLGVIHSVIRLKKRRSRVGRLRRMSKGLVERLEEFTDSGMSRFARRRERKWLAQQRNIFRFLARIPEDGKFQLSYEQLVSQPQTCVQNLCRSLGITFDPAMLNPFIKLPDLIPGLGDEKIRATKRIESGFAQEWRLKYHEEALLAETQDLMRQIGIERFDIPV